MSEEATPAESPDPLTTVTKEMINVQPELLGMMNSAIEAYKTVNQNTVRTAEIKAGTRAKLITAYQSDLRDERTHEGSRENYRMLFAVGLIVIGLAFAVYLVERAPKELVVDLVKMSLAAILGGFGGYGLRARTSTKKKQPPIGMSLDDDDDEEPTE